MKREHVTLETKLAAALLMIRDESGERLISHEHAKLMTAKQINSLFHFDHSPIRHEDGGPAEPWNLTPLLIAAHRVKTAKIDAPEAAKGRRIRRREAARLAGNPPPRKKWSRKIQSRPFPKVHRPMRWQR